MTPHQKGFVYILSNKMYPGKYKAGKTKDNPIIRAKSLTKQTGAIGEFIVEWDKEVPDINIAESILHYKFRQYHFEKEYFQFELEETKNIAEKILDSFFIDEYKSSLIIELGVRLKALKYDEKLNNLDVNGNDNNK